MNILRRCALHMLSKESRLFTNEMPSSQTRTSSKEPQKMYMHYKARSENYPINSTLLRFQFEDNYVPWNTKYEDYNPTLYTHPSILHKTPVWADSDSSNRDEFQKIEFNKIDGNINRVSYNGIYKIVNGLPLNPVGRTGICGRGILGKWGPNHAADPIVTRWMRNDDGSTVHHENSGKAILQFVCIQRRDNKEWAIPGGMVDSGEDVSLTLKREFGEEAMNTLEEEEKESTKKLIDELFKHGTEIYKGYVDDPRNTDNAWMETIAVNFHDNEGTAVGRIPLSAGDDAQAVKWKSIDGVLNLYASHTEFIHKTCLHLGAHFSF